MELQNQQWRYDSFKSYCTIKLSVLPIFGRTFRPVRRKNSQSNESIQSTRLSFQSSDRWGTLTRKGVLLLPLNQGGRHTRFRGRGWGSQFRRRDRHSGLYVIPLRPKLNLCLHATVYSTVYWTVYAPALVLLIQRLSWNIWCVATFIPNIASCLD